MSIKVVHITLSMGTGGIENLILELCKKSNRDIFDLSVICLDSAGDLFQDLQSLGVGCFVEKRKPGFDWRLILRLASLFRKLNVDVVHSHNQACAFYAGCAAFLARIPVSIVTEHSRNYIHGNAVRIWEKRLLSLIIDKWVDVSDYLASFTVNFDKINNNKVRIILNGVDCKKFCNKVKSTYCNIKNFYGLRDSAKIIIMVARFASIKNHSLMIDAFCKIVTIFDDVLLLLAGEGECLVDIKNKTLQLGLNNNVLFLGNNKNINELLAYSDVFVLCSRSEGLPLSLLEASASKVPVVLTENSNSSGFIVNMVNGTVVKDDAVSLANGIKECLINIEQSKKMASIAQQKVIERYSLDFTVKQYEDLYLELLADKRKACV